MRKAKIVTSTVNYRDRLTKTNRQRRCDSDDEDSYHTATDASDSDRDTYSTSLYAKRTSLMTPAKGTTKKATLQRRYSTNSTHGNHTKMPDRIRAFFHKNEQDEQNEEEPPASQYVYYKDPAPTRRRPTMQKLFGRMKRPMVRNDSRQNEIFVTVAVAAALVNT